MVLLSSSYSRWPLTLSRCGSAKRDLKDGAFEEGENTSFDMAEFCELGLAKELLSDYMAPVRRRSALWKFHIERSADKLHYRLFASDCQFLMYARVSKASKEGRIDFFLYDPSDDATLFDPAKPAFAMTAISEWEWRVLAERCDRCRYAPKHLACSRCRAKREVVHIRHSLESVGDGLNHCMEVHLPADEQAGTTASTLITRLPSWNEQVQSLVLDFTGRKVLPSAKNFQLAPSDKAEVVSCQYAKIKDDVFALDFRFPLTVIQAFGIALTTITWT
mmetsp:Transcript_3172/g.7434  ORF Transcript_3172/g.7434 Transcript_3172/m.7434 type:complete len:276 (-) Transcript_3172:286-1113(-)